MTDKTPKDRLLEASGTKVPKVREGEFSPEMMQKHLEQMQRTVETVMADVKCAAAAANAAQDNGKRILAFFNDYSQQRMPQQMREAFEQVAQQVVRQTFAQLEMEIVNATVKVNEMGREVYRWTWFWLRDFALCAVAMGLIGSMMVRCTLNGKLEQMDEAKQYELWGRMVEKRIAQQPPEKQKKFRAWLGVPGDDPK
ncbi:hypothetical protein [Geomonas azotofigens]|uniref:hypothetical protein n=1 Tax=Geomonas azotofigens TaxID=2843196 RepID=UPI001C121E20|nr:hypothetical protein [Geomonas azotofigens]MBU5613752.1 hypothetical protein [Geomonas azotofigens]